MTAKTAASHVAPRILQNPSDEKTMVTWGKLASTYNPGQVVYESAAGVWTIQASNAGHLQRTGVVCDNPRTDSNFARKDVDDAYAANDSAPICTSGIVVVKITDQNGGKPAGSFWILGTAGELTINSDATYFPRARNLVAVVDNDTFMLAGIGLFLFGGE